MGGPAGHRALRAVTMRRALGLAPLLVLPALFYLALFHPATLLVGNPGWLIRGTDNGENALGMHAWLHQPDGGVSLWTHLLNAPEGVGLLFTDSNPLLGLFAKLIAPLLPPNAQLVGPWILASLVAQTVFAWLLLRRFAPGPVALWLGVVLLAFPPTLANRFIHANLMAHWTILAALWLFISPARRGIGWWWLALIGVTALIHSYLLVMVGAIWASAQLVRLWSGGRRDRLAVLAEAVGTLVMVAAIAWWLGVGRGQTVAGNYGAFAMPLDALWNPGNASYSNLLPAIEQHEGRGFEGFQYLGAGGLVLVALAAWSAWQHRPDDRQRATLVRLKWLLPALVVLTLLAISNYPDIAGTRLPRIHLSESVIAALDAVRASGRMFWPVGYALVFAALLAIFRLGRDRAVLWLAVCLLLQLADLSGMSQAIRATSADAGQQRLYARTPNPAWDALIDRAGSVAFMPGDVTRDLQLFQEIAWRAAKAKRPVTSVYAARSSATTVRRLADEEAAFRRGELVAGRLYVLLPGAPLPGVPDARVMRIDDVTVIVPSSPRSAS